MLKPGVSRIGVAACLLAVTALLAFPGCKRREVVAPPAAGEAAYSVELDSPANAVRSLIAALRAERSAIARKDRAAAAKHLAVVREQIAATEVISAEVRQQTLKAARAEDVKAWVETLTELWGALLALYLETADLTRMDVPQPAEREATVLIPASGPTGEEIIRVRCVKGTDERWRVSRIDFQAASTASTMPATAPGRA